MYEENMPYVVLTVSLAMIIFAVGTFAFYVTVVQTNNAVDFNTEFTDTFTVTEPSQDQSVTLGHTASSITLVQQYNSIEWVTIPSAGYTFNGENGIVVDSDYLQG